MSSTITPHAGPIVGVTGIIEIPNEGVTLCVCETTAQIPSAKAGYLPGCVLIDKQGKKVYRNSGTLASCTFIHIGEFDTSGITAVTALTDSTGGTTTTPDTLVNPEDPTDISSATFSASPTQAELQDFRTLLNTVQTKNNNNIAKLAAKVNELQAQLAAVVALIG